MSCSEQRDINCLKRRKTAEDKTKKFGRLKFVKKISLLDSVKRLVASAISRAMQDMLLAITILSAKTVERFAMEQEVLKPHWKLENISRFLR